MFFFSVRFETLVWSKEEKLVSWIYTCRVLLFSEFKKKEVGCCWRRVLSSSDICFLKSEKDSTHRLFFPINRSSWTGQLSFLHFYVPFYALLLNLVELSINCARFHKQTTYWSSKNKFNNILTKQQISWNQGSIQSIFYTFPLVYCHDWIRKMNLVKFKVLIKI